MTKWFGRSNHSGGTGVSSVQWTGVTPVPPRHRDFIGGHSLTLCLIGALASAGLSAETNEQAKVKAALQALNDYIGTYKGLGAPDKPQPDPKESWNEKLQWSWRFKGNDCWLRLEIGKGKRFQAGELRYLPGKEVYELTMTAADGQKLVFVGKLRDGYLILDCTDAETKDVQRLRLASAGDGARFIYTLEKKRAGRTIFAKDIKVECSKEGESFAGTGGKKPQCIVTGGLGTTPVAYQGTTYYVCCSGCREAFLEAPEGYIKEYNAKKGK